MYVILFVLGLLLVIVGSNAFVEASIRIAKRFKMSEILIGATLVSVGTTLPELIVSTTAAFNGHTDMAAGNAVGSVICNTALIAGLTQTIKPTAVEPKSFKKNCAWFFAAAFLFSVISCTSGQISRLSGFALLLCFAFYTYKSLANGKDEKQASAEEEGGIAGDFIIIAVTAASLFFGARLLVDNGSIIAANAGIPEHVISVSMIALGTSLPELLTALTALRKGHTQLSLGNIIGANILNLLLVAGASGVIAPIDIPLEMRVVDIPIMLAASSILLLPTLVRKKISRFQGIAMLVIYAFYIFYIYSFR